MLLKGLQAESPSCQLICLATRSQHETSTTLCTVMTHRVHVMQPVQLLLGRLFRLRAQKETRCTSDLLFPHRSGHFLCWFIRNCAFYCALFMLKGFVAGAVSSASCGQVDRPMFARPGLGLQLQKRPNVRTFAGAPSTEGKRTTPLPKEDLINYLRGGCRPRSNWR